MDNRILVFLVMLGAIAAAIFVGAAVASGELLVPVILIVVLIGLGLVAIPESAPFLLTCTYASGLTVPGLPGQFGLYYATAFSVAGAAVLLAVFRRKNGPRPTWSHHLLVAFCIVVLATGFYRGFGFQSLGSPAWGGFIYLSIFIPATLVFTLPLVNMSAEWWPRAIVIMGLLAPLPLIADLLVTHGFSLGAVRLFLKTGDTIGTLLAEQGSDSGLGRLTSAGVAAQSMIIAFLAIFPTRNLFQVRSFPVIALLGGIVFLSFLSGFRLMTGMLIFIVFLTAFYQKTLTLSRVIVGTIAVGVILTIIYWISSSLPLNIQRTLSWLPGITVSDSVNRDAEGTITWRLDLWRESIRYIPEYFWAGKGFSYNGSEYLSMLTGYGSFDSIQWALVTGAYHNGYLSLILLLGIFGFLTGLPLLVLVVVRHTRTAFLPWNNQGLLRCHQAFLAAETCWVLVYLTVYGDVSDVYPQFLFNWAVMEALRLCDQQFEPVTGKLSEVQRPDEELALIE